MLSRWYWSNTCILLQLTGWKAFICLNSENKTCTLLSRIDVKDSQASNLLLARYCARMLCTRSCESYKEGISSQRHAISEFWNTYWLMSIHWLCWKSWATICLSSSTECRLAFSSAWIDGTKVNVSAASCAEIAARREVFLQSLSLRWSHIILACAALHQALNLANIPEQMAKSLHPIALIAKWSCCLPALHLVLNLSHALWVRAHLSKVPLSRASKAGDSSCVVLIACILQRLLLLAWHAKATRLRMPGEALKQPCPIPLHCTNFWSTWADIDVHTECSKAAHAS